MVSCFDRSTQDVRLENWIDMGELFSSSLMLLRDSQKTIASL